MVLHFVPCFKIVVVFLLYFSQARLLSYQLTKKPLPGLTSIEQLELLALADTFASAKLDLEESPGSIERGVKFAKKDGMLINFRSSSGPQSVITPFLIHLVLFFSFIQINIYSGASNFAELV